MTYSGRILIAVLLSLSITALLAAIGIKLVRDAARGVVQSPQRRDTEAQEL